MSDTYTTDEKHAASDARRKAISKVKKLLAMASQQASPQEAELAAQRAAEILEKYNVNFAEVTIEELRHGDGIVGEKVYANVNKGAAKVISEWAQWLCTAVAEFYDCHANVTDGTIKLGEVDIKARMIEFIGYETDVRVCSWMYEYLFQTILRHSIVHGQQLNQEGIIGNAMKKPLGAFREGCALEIARRLRVLLAERDKRRQGDEKSTALVLMKRHSIEAAFGQFEYRTSNLDYDQMSNSFAIGVKVGNKVGLNTPVGADPAKPMIGDGS
jgi:Protein of unknown function (DUF2786)